MNKKWLSVRVVHTTGGIRLINEKDPLVRIHPNSVQNKVATFETPEYGTLFESIESLRLPIIGVEFYSYSYQFEGKDLPEWRVYARNSNTVWGNEEGVMLWSNIGTGAHENKNGRLWDVASRISYQLSVCAWRLKELSDSYNSQLISKVSKNDFTNGTRFTDGFTWLCYMAIQSFLVDVCILRDYLSEFAAHFIFHSFVNEKIPNITSLSGLRKIILKKHTSDDELFIEFNQIIEDYGWLKELGEYRDLVVHSAPLAQAEKRLFAVCNTVSINGGELPAISCPLPKNPMGIAVSRAKGTLFEDFEKQFNLFVGASNKEEPHMDGLEYCHSVMTNISDLANKLATRTPVKPKMKVFDNSNIISEFKYEII